MIRFTVSDSTRFPRQEVLISYEPAASMARLGTETAFEVLVRARALEAQGRNIIHLEIGEPDFDTPRHIVNAPGRARPGLDHAARRRACPNCASQSPPM